MEILLIRHGLAGKPNPSKYADDDLRPLTSKGRKLFKRALRGLVKTGFKPELILTSPAFRCLQTAKLVGREFELEGKKTLSISSLHHNIKAAKAITKLSGLKLPNTLILVGHEPRLGEMISLLATGQHSNGFTLSKGGAALLSMSALKPGKGRLEWLMTQEQLIALT